MSLDAEVCNSGSVQECVRETQHTRIGMRGRCLRVARALHHVDYSNKSDDQAQHGVSTIVV